MEPTIGRVGAILDGIDVVGEVVGFNDGIGVTIGEGVGSSDGTAEITIGIDEEDGRIDG